MSTLTRREFLAGSAALAARPARRPNILFLMVDEMRWDAMGCAGHPVVKTPNLDRLARQGVRFHACYTVSPVCSPARASLFTGRYAHVHGVIANGVPAHPGEIFLPSILKHYGYHTRSRENFTFGPYSSISASIASGALRPKVRRRNWATRRICAKSTVHPINGRSFPARARGPMIRWDATWACSSIPKRTSRRSGSPTELLNTSVAGAARASLGSCSSAI